MTMKTGYDDIEPFVTKDGSIIRELLGTWMGLSAEEIGC